MPFASGEMKQPLGIGNLNIFNVKISLVAEILQTFISTIKNHCNL